MAIATPPVDLNQHIDHEPILQSLEIPVKDHLPTKVECPFCSAHELGVYVAPTVGGRWYYCRACGFRGDSIELYCEAHKLPDMRDAIFELMAKRILPMTRDQVTLDVANKYLTEQVYRRKQVAELFSKAQEAIKLPDAKLLTMLQDYNIWVGFKSGNWVDHIGKFIGALHPKVIRTYGYKIPKTADFARVLVLPYYDIPGHIASFLFLGANGASIRVSADPKSSDDDGLMMLDSIEPYNQHVIAINDPIFALQLQRRQFNRTKTPLPLVVYDVKTQRAWQSVNARRVIYWSERMDYWLYKQALSHPRAYIASRPDFDDRETYVASKSLPVILDQFHDSSKTWAEAMKDKILHGEHWEISDFVLNLEMAATDIQRIYDVCTPAEKRRVQQALGEVTFDRFVYIGGLRINETDDSWWVVNKDHRELGCSAIIRLDAAIHVPDADQNYYEGVVTSKGQQIAFREKMDAIEKNTSVWLRDLLMRNGQPPPIIQNKLRPQLITIAKQFQEPQYVRRSGKVGWNAELHGFVFPNFTIRHGGIDESSRAMVYDTNVPAANIKSEALSMGDWDDMLEDTPESAAMWAGLACFMTNFMAPVLAAPQAGVGFIGGSGSVARLVGLHLAKELDMVMLKPSKARFTMDDVRSTEQEHGYPIWLDVGPANRHQCIPYLRADTTGNVMLSLLDGAATALSVGDQWVFVDGNRVADQSKPLPSIKGAMRYLAWIQTHNFSLQPATSLQESVLHSLSEWASLDLGMIDQSVFRSAQQVLISPDAFGAENKLLRLIFWLQANTGLKTVDQPFYEMYTAGVLPTKGIVVIDKGSKKVFVSLAGMHKALRSAKLPAPNVDEAVRCANSAGSKMGFEMGEECFVVNYDHWQSELTKWRKMRV